MNETTVCMYAAYVPKENEYPSIKDLIPVFDPRIFNKAHNEAIMLAIDAAAKAGASGQVVASIASLLKME